MSTTDKASTDLNLEVPLGDLEGLVSASFYRRSNLDLPSIDASAWQLRVDGAVANPVTLDYRTLLDLPRVSLTVVMECAGNGRSLMSPVPAGTPWNLGAVSSAVFTGAYVRDLLSRVRPDADAVEVLFHGADSGVVDGRRIHFQRSIPLGSASEPGPLLAWEMNGEPLPREHGYPLRLVMPGWYGMASVKWLTRIECLTRPFHGAFQGDRYVYRQDPVENDEAPVTRIRVRSLITSPAHDTVTGPTVVVRGVAWSGAGPIAAVEISANEGATWSTAELEPAAEPFAPTLWHATWTPSAPGTHTLICRATDASGDTQPLQPRWNELGYANNVVHRITVHTS